MKETRHQLQKGFTHHFILPLLVFIAVGAIGAYVIATSSAASTTYRVWQWNIAGKKMNGGSTTNGMVKTAISSIKARNVQLVSFNEMCKNQYDSVRSSLKKAGWSKSKTFSAFVATKTKNCGNNSYGNAIFVKAGLSNVNRYTLPSDGSNEARAMVCARVAKESVRFCSVHITTSNEVVGNATKKINELQLAAVQDALNAYYASGQKVIIAGDFNAQPNYGRMDNWYAPSLNTPNNNHNSGVYREVDDNDSAHCIGYGEYTAVGSDTDKTPCGTPHKKIDMIFFRENQVESYTGDSLAVAQKCGPKKNAACSDHRILIGNIKFK